MELLDLPREVLLGILDNVSVFDIIFNVKLVCKYVRELCYDPALFRRLDLRYKVICDNDAFTGRTNIINHIRSVGEHVRSLVFGYDDFDLDEDSTRSVTDHDLTTNHYEQLSTSEIFGCLVNLKSLSIQGFDRLDPKVSQDVMIMLQTHPKIEDLTFTIHGYSTEECQPMLLCQPPKYDNGNFSVSLHWKLIPRQENGIKDGFVSESNKNVTSLGSVEDIQSMFREELLTYLSVTGLVLKDIRLSASYSVDMSKWFVGNGHLTSVHLTGMMTNDNDLIYISECCPNLKNVSMQSCGHLTDIGISYLAKHCCNLERFALNEELYGSEGNITDLGLQSIAEDCKNLKCLVVNECPGVSDRGIISIADNCPGLREIQVAGCIALSDVAVESLVRNCPILYKVNLNQCVKVTARSVNMLVEECQYLHTLFLETCHQLSKFDFVGLTDAKTTFHSGTECSVSSINPVNSQKIKSVDLISNNNEDIKSACLRKDSFRCFNNSSRPSDSEMPINHPNVPDIPGEENNIQINRYNDHSSEFKHTIKKSGRSPDDDNTSNRSQKDVMNVPCTVQKLTSIFNQPNIVKTVRHSHIRVLNLSYCSTIVDNAVVQIAKHLPDLTEISLRSCNRVTDDAVCHLLQGCKFLKRLDLSGGSAIQASKLTDTSLGYISEYGGQLEELTMVNNNRITNDGVKQVLASCHVIRFVWISWTSGAGLVTRRDLERFFQEIPHKKLTVKQEENSRSGRHGRVKGRIMIFCRPRLGTNSYKN